MIDLNVESQLSNHIQDVQVSCSNIEDLRHRDSQDQLRKVADSLISKGLDLVQLTNLELLATTAPLREQLTLPAQIAIKLARAKSVCEILTDPIHIDIIVPVFEETNRIRIQGEEDQNHHPNGEDFLREKVRQIEWLLNSTNGRHTYHLRFIADGYDSKTVSAASSVYEDVLGILTSGKISFETLQDGFIETKNTDTNAGNAINNLRQVSSSKKGGAVMYGMDRAIDEFNDSNRRHMVTFTDADLSTNLGFIGLAMSDLYIDGKSFFAGSRESDLSVSDRSGTEFRYRAMIYLRDIGMPGIFPLDTQNGFKGGRAEALVSILPQMSVYDFSFDIDFLANISKLFGIDSLGIVGTALQESLEESKPDGTTYFKRLQTIYSIIKENQDEFGNTYTQRVVNLFTLFLNFSTSEQACFSMWKKFLDKVHERGMQGDFLNHRVTESDFLDPLILDEMEVIATKTISSEL